MRLFADNSPFNTPLADNAPIDPNSATITAALLNAVGPAAAHSTINTTSWSCPIYRVGPTQPDVEVRQTWYEPVPAPKPLGKVNPALQTAWSAVPIPPTAKAAAPTGIDTGDKHCVVWQPSTDKLWEFWHLENTPTAAAPTVPVWTAYWGGAIQGVSDSSGAYDPSAWLGAQNGWGGTACSISVAAGLITLDDCAAGVIDHALAIACPETRAGAWCAPAKRTDGGSALLSSIPEGARLRIDPKVDLESLEMPPFTLMMAKAAQKYGIFIRDSAGNVPFYAEDPSRLIAAGEPNPYTGPSGYFHGQTPQQLLATFPWQHVQLLEMTLLP